MDWKLRETVFSTPRMGRYLAKYGRDATRAGKAYDHNIRLAQALMPALHTVEIALRNAIHHSLARSLKRLDWWNALPTSEFGWLIAAVKDASDKLARRGERVTTDKIVAELTFGSWTRLFNAQQGSPLSKQLLLAFPICPKKKRQRQPIRSALNRVRNLRNRVMHHEPLLWVSPSVHDVHAEILEILEWIDPGINRWLCNHDSWPIRWAECAVI